MSLLSIFKPKPFFSEAETEAITDAIKASEKKTSGEIRVFIESRCKYVEPLDRAVEIFYSLKMDQTAEKNAVLVYLALKDHQLGIFADEGIHQRTGNAFWKQEVATIVSHFSKENFVTGLVTIVNEIGEVLKTEFPYQPGTDKNELPDDIVFGR